MKTVEKIKEDMKAAMKEKAALKLEVLRGLITAFTNELVATSRTPQDELSDEEAQAVISRAAKQRKDSIEQFTNGDRPELADKEKEELVIIESYLPEMMGEDEVRTYVLSKKDEMGIETADQFGQLMGAVMGGLKGKADGGVVKEVIEEALQD
jgi:uncharacterized protein